MNTVEQNMNQNRRQKKHATAPISGQGVHGRWCPRPSRLANTETNQHSPSVRRGRCRVCNARGIRSSVRAGARGPYVAALLPCNASTWTFILRCHFFRLSNRAWRSSSTGSPPPPPPAPTACATLPSVTAELPSAVGVSPSCDARVSSHEVGETGCPKETHCLVEVDANLLQDLIDDLVPFLLYANVHGVVHCIVHHLLSLLHDVVLPLEFHCNPLQLG